MNATIPVNERRIELGGDVLRRCDTSCRGARALLSVLYTLPASGRRDLKAGFLRYTFDRRKIIKGSDEDFSTISIVSEFDVI